MRNLITGIFCLFSFASLSQPGAIGSWREHLPYRQGQIVADGTGRIFCATSQGLFSYRKDDQSLERFSKLNGLNDFGISHIAYNNDYHQLIIAYENANIDLLADDNSVINLSDISRKNIPGSKRINHITNDGRYVYFACGFGIVVLDLERKEIKDTYYIGFNGAAVDVKSVALNDTYIFAATDNGVYQASLSNPNLSDFNNWSVILTDTGSGEYNHAAVISNTLLVNYHLSSGDSILQWNNGWGLPSLPQNSFTEAFEVKNNQFYLTQSDKVLIYDASLSLIQTIDINNVPNLKSRDAISDDAGVIWIADEEKGMIQYTNGTWQSMFPAGPNSSAAAAMEVVDGKLWIVHGPKNRGWTNNFQYTGFSWYEDGAWKTYDGYTSQTPLFPQYNFYDNMALTVDPSNKEHLFVSSGGRGLLEFQDGNAVNHYDDTNSTLKQQFGNPGQVKVHGIRMDDEGNIWATNAGVNTVLNARLPSGQWIAYSFAGISNSKAGDLVIDQNGGKWLTLFENSGGSDGLLYFNDNGTPSDLSDDESAPISFASNRVRSLIVDNDGTLWVGLDAGLRVIYPPSIQPQQIIIKQDGAFQYLLETESVTAFAVDGANRKWIGTENAGVFLFSADGQEQIQHFTIDNSPLFSNNIYSLAIDGKSGQVYIGTDKGLLSYQSDAVDGKETCDDVEVYPNPVQRSYNGPVAIKGIPANGTIKITDVSGNLVFQAEGLGGQAIWNGNNLKGERVSTGVYIVFAMDPEGANTCSSKILFNR